MKQAAPNPKRPKEGMRRKRERLGIPASAGKPDASPAVACGSVLAWCAADYHKKNDLKLSALAFLFGSGIVVVPVTALFLLANIVMFVVSLFTGEAPRLRIPENEDLVILALAAVGMGTMLPLFGIMHKDVIRYDIDLEARQLTLHQSRFPNRVDVVTIPFSAIVSIAPYLPTTYADTGGFYFTYATGATKPQEWKTRDSLAQKTVQAHTDALRALLAERVHDWIRHDP